MPPRFRARFLVAAALGLSVAFGVVASSCGPKEKFCPNTQDGVCVPPMDASTVDTGVEVGPTDALILGAG
jgi:hypothetical protein